jgi:hypothetical protein
MNRGNKFRGILNTPIAVHEVHNHNNQEEEILGFRSNVRGGKHK